MDKNVRDREGLRGKIWKVKEVGLNYKKTTKQKSKEMKI
jgi:hypothetical protein